MKGSSSKGFGYEAMSEALVNGLAGAGGGIIAQALTHPLQAINTRQQTERKARISTAQLSDGKQSADATRTKSHSTCKELSKQVLQEEGWRGLFRGLGPSLVGTAASQGIYYYFYQLFKDEADAVALRRKAGGFGDGTSGMLSSLIVASMAGCLNVLLTNPIWVVVTRMQTFSQAAPKKSGNLEIGIDEEKNSSEQPLNNGCNYGFIAAINDLYNEAGIGGFWKGVLPTLIMVSNPSIQFMLYEAMLKRSNKRRFSNPKHGSTDITALEVFLLGAIAKLGATVATYPLLVVKSRLQAKQVSDDKMHEYAGTVDAISKMIRYEGIAGFYKGVGTKILQSVFAAAVLFMVKEELARAARRLLSSQVPVQHLPGAK